MNEQETIRKAQGRLLTSIDFHEQRTEELREKLGALRKRCEHPRIIGTVVVCPDCGYISPKAKSKKGEVAA